MARSLTTALEAATVARNVPPILLLELVFDSVTTRVWSGWGDLVWGARTFTGAGTLGAVSPVEEATELRATGLDLTLSGIPSSVLSLALSEPYQGRLATVWMGALDPNTFALVADPYQIFQGRMDVMTVADSGETATITISVESRLIDLERSRERRYDDADQKIDYPTDRFFEYVPSLQDIEIKWGQS
jgi:hypothetical protein